MKRRNLPKLHKTNADDYVSHLRLITWIVCNSLLNNNRCPGLKPELDKNIAYFHIFQQLPHQRPIKLRDGARLGINEVAKRLYTVPVLSFGSFVHISLLLLFTQQKYFFHKVIIVLSALRSVYQLLLQLMHCRKLIRQYAKLKSVYFIYSNTTIAVTLRIIIPQRWRKVNRQDKQQGYAVDHIIVYSHRAFILLIQCFIQLL